MNLKGKIIIGLFDIFCFLLGEILLLQVIFQRDKDYIWIPCFVGGFLLIGLVCAVHDSIQRHIDRKKTVYEQCFKN